MAIHNQAQDIVPKVKYEFEMLEWAAKKIKAEFSNADQPTKNMLLEVFLLHARVLRDFFVKSPSDDDVSTQHFFDAPSVWVSKANTLCQTLEKERVRLNKKLAHLTYSRLTEEEEWDFNGIHDELLKAKHEFLDALEPDQRKWFV